MASGSSGIDVEGEGAFAGKGPGGCEGSSDGESRESIVTMQLSPACINCRQNYNRSGCERNTRLFWW
jgi:hypothetical protein